MKFAAVTVFVTFCLAVGADAGTLQLSNNGLTLHGNANVQFYGPKEDVWFGLSNGKTKMIQFLDFRNLGYGFIAVRVKKKESLNCCLLGIQISQTSRDFRTFILRFHQQQQKRERNC